MSEGSPEKGSASGGTLSCATIGASLIYMIKGDVPLGWGPLWQVVAIIRCFPLMRTRDGSPSNSGLPSLKPSPLTSNRHVLGFTVECQSIIVVCSHFSWNNTRKNTSICIQDGFRYTSPKTSKDAIRRCIFEKARACINGRN